MCRRAQRAVQMSSRVRVVADQIGVLSIQCMVSLGPSSDHDPQNEIAFVEFFVCAHSHYLYFLTYYAKRL